MGHARRDNSESVDAEEALEESRRAWNCGGVKSMSMSIVQSDIATSMSDDCTGSDEGKGTSFICLFDCCINLPRVRGRDFHIREQCAHTG